MKSDIRHTIDLIENEVAKCIKAAYIKSLLVAVSGGADSVALLMASTRVATRINLRVEAVNCNFHLRGDESDRDSKFTSDLCASLGIRLHSIDYDVDAYIKENPGISIEMACRELRYADFFRIMNEEGFDRIAVAHNSDDDIETMMLNMLRGCGSRGLKGMDVDNGKVIRPLLGISRKEIEEYLEALNVGFITDSSNLTSEYRRNFIRREVIPLLELRWHSAKKSLSKTVRIIKEEANIIANYYKEQLLRLSPDDHTLLVYSEGVTVGVILRFIEPYGGNAEIAEEIKESLSKDFKQRRWKLSERYEASLERDRLMIIDSVEIFSDSPTFTWEKTDLNAVSFETIKQNRDHNIVYLPSGSDEYILRPPHTGDRIAPLGMKGTRLVSDIVSEAKLDRKSKTQIRVLARKSDGKIIWVSGLKRSRHDLLQPDAKSCFKLEKK
ncbi:MAG: tRNA lysidine(34) synthetase TilS [Muribaculaceae bacterium]|nr:tRNA lysidine(34) synthetase TilS [Muribaculaceae bacterium]